MPRTRRALLAALTATLAGCGSDSVGSSSATTTTNSETPSPTDSPTATETASPTATPTTPQRVELDDTRARWRVDFQNPVGGLAVADGRIYLGSSGQTNVTPQPDKPKPRGGFAALAVPSGEIASFRELPAPVTDGPIVHNGEPYVVVGYSNGYDGNDQRVLRTAPDGNTRWESARRDAWLRFYAVDDAAIYLGTGDDALSATGETTFALNQSDGSKRWSIEGGDAGAGRVVESTLFADYAGTAMVALDIAAGTERWRLPAEAHHSRTQSFPMAGERLFATVERSTKEAFAAVNVADGETVWERPDIEAISITLTQDVAVGTSYDGTLFAVDLATGETRWSRQFSGRPEAPLAVGGRLYVVFSDGPMVAVDPTNGEVVWQVDSWSGRYVAHLSADGGSLVTAASGAEEAIITARKTADGSIRWERRLPGRMQTLERTDDLLAVATRKSVYGVVL